MADPEIDSFVDIYSSNIYKYKVYKYDVVEKKFKMMTNEEIKKDLGEGIDRGDYNSNMEQLMETTLSIAENTQNIGADVENGDSLKIYEINVNGIVNYYKFQPFTTTTGRIKERSIPY